jgi:hypothetical protein
MRYLFVSGGDTHSIHQHTSANLICTLGVFHACRLATCWAPSLRSLAMLRYLSLRPLCPRYCLEQHQSTGCDLDQLGQACYAICLWLIMTLASLRASGRRFAGQGQASRGQAHRHLHRRRPAAALARRTCQVFQHGEWRQAIWLLQAKHCREVKPSAQFVYSLMCKGAHKSEL